MRTHHLLFIALILSACGNTPANPAQNNPNGGSDGGVAPDLQSSSGQVDVTYKLMSFPVAPGEEKILCQYVPADGTQRFVRRFVTDMSAGSHHLVVFRVNEKIGRPMETGLYPCTQIDVPAGFDGLLPGSQEPHTDFTLPDGVAFDLEGYHGLVFQMHYINATQTALTAQVTWALGTMPADQVKQQAGLIFYSNFGLDIPPGMSTSSMTCKAPADVKLMATTGHMHKHGLTFDASVAGQPVFHTANWDEPMQQVFAQPGFAVKKGDPIAWSCAYENDTGAALHFGNSAATDEMCIFVALYYPAPGNATDFGCIR